MIETRSNLLYSYGMNKIKRTLLDQIHQLNSELVIARACYGIYKNITFDRSDDFQKIYSNIPSLINAERNIFFSQLVIQFYKFLDTHPESISLERLLAEFSKNPSYDTIKVEHTKLIDRYMNPIRTIRNKVCALA